MLIAIAKVDHDPQIARMTDGVVNDGDILAIRPSPSTKMVLEVRDAAQGAVRQVLNLLLGHTTREISHYTNKSRLKRGEELRQFGFLNHVDGRVYPSDTRSQFVVHKGSRDVNSSSDQSLGIVDPA